MITELRHSLALLLETAVRASATAASCWAGQYANFDVAIYIPVGVVTI